MARTVIAISLWANPGVVSRFLSPSPSSLLCCSVACSSSLPLLPQITASSLFNSTLHLFSLLQFQMSWCGSHHEDSRNYNGKGRGASAPIQIANSKQRIWPYSYQNSAYNSDNTRACLTMTSEVTSNASPIDHHSTHHTCSGLIKSSKSLYNMGTSHSNRDPGEAMSWSLSLPRTFHCLYPALLYYAST